MVDGEVASPNAAVPSAGKGVTGHHASITAGTPSSSTPRAPRGACSPQRSRRRQPQAPRRRVLRPEVSPGVCSSQSCLIRFCPVLYGLLCTPMRCGGLTQKLEASTGWNGQSGRSLKVYSLVSEYRSAVGCAKISTRADILGCVSINLSGIDLSIDPSRISGNHSNLTCSGQAYRPQTGTGRQ